eukprot:8372413-Lingulodinium_polyedra.AAC.1
MAPRRAFTQHASHAATLCGPRLGCRRPSAWQRKKAGCPPCRALALAPEWSRIPVPAGCVPACTGWLGTCCNAHTTPQAALQMSWSPLRLSP